MGRYVVRRLLNYVVLLAVAVSLTYFLAATQLNPRALYEVQNPPLDPAVDRGESAGQEPQRRRADRRALLDLGHRRGHPMGLGPGPAGRGRQ